MSKVFLETNLLVYALIVVAAESARCSEPWTEDLDPGPVIRGVKVVNPFAWRP